MIDKNFLKKLSKQASRQGQGHKVRVLASPAREWKIIVSVSVLVLLIGSISIWSIYNSFSEDAASTLNNTTATAPSYPRQFVEQAVVEYRELNKNYRSLFLEGVETATNTEEVVREDGEESNLSGEIESVVLDDGVVGGGMGEVTVELSN